MEHAASCDRFQHHECTDNPDQAAVILFVENADPIPHFFREVRTHPYYQQHAEKCFLHTKSDLPVPFLPGVYASLQQSWHRPSRTRTGGYLKAFTHHFIEADVPVENQDLLYSFIGKRSTHPIRDQVLALNHERQFLFDTTPYWPYGELDDATRHKLEQQYADVSLRSKFILCPRGIGTSSIRLFESLRMGRAPVIISDDWVPPEGPDWSACSIRVPEDQVDRIPQLLEAREDDAEVLGCQARQVWDDYFAADAIFHRVVEWCLSIKRSRPLPERLLRFTVLSQLLHPIYGKALLRELLPDSLVSRLRS